jgi:hypothetical protein
MVEVDSHLKLIPLYTSDTYKRHIQNVSTDSYGASMGIREQHQKVTPLLLVSDVGILGHLWSQNDIITSCLRLTAYSNYFPHPY